MKKTRLHKSNFGFSLFSYQKISAMILANKGLGLVGIFIRIFSILGRPSRGTVVVIRYSLQRFSKIAKTQGLTGLVLTLKQCTVLLQHYVCGHTGIAPTHPRVRVMGSGKRSVLHPNLRYFIRQGHNSYIRLTLTMFSLYRDIMIPGKLKITSITNPFSGRADVVAEVISMIPLFHKLFIQPALPRGSSDLRQWLSGKFSYFPIMTSSPQTADGQISSSPSTLIKSALSLLPNQLQYIRVLSSFYKEASYKGINPYKWIMAIRSAFCATVVPREVLGSSDPELHYLFPPQVIPEKILPPSAALPNDKEYKVKYQGATGKLGFKDEAAGKVRVFAMIDPWSQWVLAPIHKGIFSILRKYPNVDGTFDQLRPLKRSKGFKSLFSMDLSSATDRLPLSIQTPLVKTLFGFTSKEADAWASLLVDRDYQVPRAGKIRYQVGQPMGGLSSWPMLALTHHLIVQVAAWTSGHSRIVLFQDYAVLGDDIVIYNSTVARRYHAIILGLGVECNLAKSILSPKGLGLEFAKRLWVKGLDASPIPLKEVYSSLQGVSQLVEFRRKYNLNITQLAKFAGFGYKTLGSLNRPFAKLPLKLRYVVFSDIFSSPAELEMIFRAHKLRLFENKIFVHALEAFVTSYASKLFNRWFTVIFELSQKDILHFNTLLKGQFNLVETPINRTSVQRVSSLQKSNFLEMWKSLHALTIESSFGRVLETYAKASLQIHDLFALKQNVDTTFGGVFSGFGQAITLYEVMTQQLGRLLAIVKIETFANSVSPSFMEVVRRLPLSKRPGEPKAHRVAKAWNELFHRKDYIQLMKDMSKAAGTNRFYKGSSFTSFFWFLGFKHPFWTIFVSFSLYLSCTLWLRETVPDHENWSLFGYSLWYVVFSFLFVCLGIYLDI